MITLENVRKSYGEIEAVKGISFKISRGEVVGLLGPNGAGKSTTMRMITGYLQPDVGAITVCDIPVSEDPVRARSHIGYLPESAPLYLEMEVLDFLSYVAALRQMPAKDAKKNIKNMIELCGLGSVVGRPIGELSKGYRQRVGLAAAILPSPSILILDEPTSGLDPNQIQDVRSLIREVGQERTVILSTHILQEVEAVCDRALIINQGQLVSDGSISELRTRSQGHVRYHMLINAAENLISTKIAALQGATLVSCRTTLAPWNEAVVEASDALAGEDLFQWTVANGWKLRELRQEGASLEDVFRNLTQ